MAAATTLSSPLPSPAAYSDSSDLSPLSIVLLMVAVVGIPILIYAFFMGIKRPPNPFWRHPQPSLSGSAAKSLTISEDMVELVSDLKYKEEDTKEYGSVCPVCLSVFAEGEDVWLLKACKHVFHGACINTWLHSHSNCPVCRGSVPIKRSKKLVADGGHRDDDFQQGLPGSADLV